MKKNTKQSLFVLVAGAALACSAAPLPPPSRVLCYAVADTRAQARVDAECGPVGDAGVAFAECPAHDSILEQLKRDQEACK